MTDLVLKAAQRKRIVVSGGNYVELYYQVVNTQNVESLDNFFQILPTSGTILASTFPEYGADILNRSHGVVGDLNVATSGITKINTSNLETNLRRVGVTFSGSRIAKRR